MSDPHSARWPDREDKRTFLQKLVEFIHPGPDSRAELLEVLTEAESNALIDAEVRLMLERVIGLTDVRAGDVMVPAPRMDMLPVDATLDALLPTIIGVGHSRFPVYQGERENIVGVLIAKDLLKLQHNPQLQMCDLLRPAMFVPESKGLNDLLREFRGNRNHMAIVIDEFGRVAGLLTIEDVLEQIVGEIEDEFDLPEDQGDILGLPDKTYRVSGDTPVDRLAQALGLPLCSSDAHLSFETISGLIAHEMGHAPRRGEQIQLCGLQFSVLHTRGGAVRWLKVSPADTPPAAP